MWPKLKNNMRKSKSELSLNTTKTLFYFSIWHLVVCTYGANHARKVCFSNTRKRVLFAALFFTLLQSNLSSYFQSNYSKNEPFSFYLWRVRYKINQIIAIPKNIPLFLFASFDVFGRIVTHLDCLPIYVKQWTLFGVFVFRWTLENRWSLKQDFLA